MMEIMGLKEQVELESLVDKFGLVRIVEVLGNICYEKADHLEVNWQESNNSDQLRTWKRNGKTLDRVASGLWRQSWERIGS